MKVYSFYIKALLVCHAILASCTDYVVKDPNFMPPDVVINDDTGNNDIIEGLPTPRRNAALQSFTLRQTLSSDKS